MYVIAGLDDDPYPHGLSIKEEIESHYSNEVNHGRLYQNLDQLVEMGLVEKGEIDDRTNSYALTDRGRQEVEVRHEWESQYLKN